MISVFPSMGVSAVGVGVGPSDVALTTGGICVGAVSVAHRSTGIDGFADTVVGQNHRHHVVRRSLAVIALKRGLAIGRQREVARLYMIVETPSCVANALEGIVIDKGSVATAIGYTIALKCQGGRAKDIDIADWQNRQCGSRYSGFTVNRGVLVGRDSDRGRHDIVGEVPSIGVVLTVSVGIVIGDMTGTIVVYTGAVSSTYSVRGATREVMGRERNVALDGVAFTIDIGVGGDQLGGFRQIDIEGE